MKKTTIQGTPPQFDNAVLKEKQDKAVSAFLKSGKSKHHLRAEIPALFFSKLEQLVKEGYTITLDFPYNLAPLAYSLFLIKPEHLLVDEIEKLKEQEKDSYIIWLQAEHERYQALLVQQMVERAEREEEEKQAKQRAKQLEDFKEKAKTVYTPLEIPSYN